jgi:hypothetical protein
MTRKCEASKKFHALWRNAMDRGDVLEMVAIRVDRESWMQMQQEAYAFGGGDIDVYSLPDREKWRGLPRVLEAYLPPMPSLADAEEIDPMATIEYQPIASIECRDRRSGRPVFLNDSANPPGYA